MNKQIQFVTLLFNDLRESVALFYTNGGHSTMSKNYMNKNHGKTAIKRKITMLRQELLNLERMIDDE